MMIYEGDCLQVMPTLDANSVDAIVTDPPYGLSFMGKEWDHGVPGVEFWEAALRVMKPGAHLLAFGGTRTFHRLTSAIEDAGFEIRDCMMWLYGSGFPKSLDVSKAIDKAAGAERPIVGKGTHGKGSYSQGMGKQNGFRPYKAGLPSENNGGVHDITAPATAAAKQWSGWGTALKPAWEPIILARKPLEGTVAENVQKWGTGAINIDGGRIPTNWDTDPTRRGWQGGDATSSKSVFGNSGSERISQPNASGRWPANVLLDEEVTKEEWSRFFYCAKASKKDRGEGNNHPTVKPIALLEYLIRLVTPPNGLILDPFCGSGSTGVAAVGLGFNFLGIEKESTYAEIARKRIEATERPLLGVAV
jgi:site-specific DNA-methyltransferase (adenine-specific)